MWDQSSKRTISDISKTPASQKPLININVRRFLPPTPASQNQSLQRRRKRRPRLLLPTSASEVESISFMGRSCLRSKRELVRSRRGKNAYQWGPIASNFGIARRGFAEASQKPHNFINGKPHRLKSTNLLPGTDCFQLLPGNISSRRQIPELFERNSCLCTRCREQEERNQN
ncbi:hypothetical protein LXL04_011857 [Taraxacum kok-saghyz]